MWKGSHQMILDLPRMSYWTYSTEKDGEDRGRDDDDLDQEEGEMD
tara:strand:+ start:730 stop:864 length:135 start_codon:yes stop_codon:yes gene_type:complete